MTATRTLSRKLTVLLAAAIAAAAMAAFASSASATLNLTSFDGGVFNENGDAETQAGGRPFIASTGFTLESQLSSFNGFIDLPYPLESLKDAKVELPAGFVGNPQAIPACSQEQFIRRIGSTIFDSCPVESQIGYVAVLLGGPSAFLSTPEPEPFVLPLYNMQVPFGTPGVFGFNIVGTPAYISAEVRSGEDYGLDVLNANAPATLAIIGASFKFWGVPADPVHDPERGMDSVGASCADQRAIAPCSNPSDAPLAAYLTLPTSCVGPVDTTLHADSWEFPGAFDTESFTSHATGEPLNTIGTEGCNAVPFEPEIQARPTTNVADSASGLDVNLHIPTHENCDPGPPVSCETASAHMRDTTVTLPEGLVLNPAAGNGLRGCSLAEFGYTSTDPDGSIHTTPDPATCPDASRVASVQVESPALEDPLKGSVYLANPHANPFNSLLALYITIDDPKTGIVVKLAGKVDLDPDTGRVSATFVRNPQLPVEDFSVHFFGGASGALRTPATCGNYTTTSVMTPWTAPDSGPPATPSDTWAIQTAPGGGACPASAGAIPNSPDLDAGSLTPVAAANTPTIVNLRRNDGTQEFSTVSLTLPPGLTGKLSGIGTCSDADLAAAASKSGNEEKASPSCPANSRIGTVDVAAGAGPAPYNTQGTAYLTGPYKGAPLGMAIITPATAGPFDLGTVVVRVALFVDRNSAQITAVSDPIPHILQGIPLDVRSAKVTLDRANFTRNGTSCNPSSFTGNLVSTLNNTAALSERFQLGECSALAFKPKLGIRLFGGTKRGAHPALRAVLQMPAGGANIAKATVALPHSEFLDQAHIGTVCTRVQFAAKDCPAASVYGNVIATSPLVNYALQGPVYLRSSNNKLPDLVMALHGPPSQPIEVDAVGRIDSVKGGIRTSFEGAPDLPVSSLVLNMAGGKKGLLQNSTNICVGKHKASAEFTGQNGKVSDFAPVLKNGKCGKSGKAKKRKASHRRNAR
jgi:hypothetical protein